MTKNIFRAALCAVFVFSAALVSADDYMEHRRAMRDHFRMTQYFSGDCSVLFPRAAMGGDAFEDKLEHYIETSSFWEKCVQPYLDKGQNATIAYTVYTEKAIPNAREIALGVRSAEDFTEEFTDYVEDVQQYTGAYERPERFTKLQVPSNINLNKVLKRKVKKANRYFKAKSEMPKVIVNVTFTRADQPENIGAIKVAGPSAKENDFFKSKAEIVSKDTPAVKVEPAVQK